jgi:multidrug efflux pump subunit AcrB
MILLFLGSWRSTLVVMISIPLSVLSSLVVLYFLGDTLNTMTLGGLALAIGILVDDSTVTIENTHRLLTEEGQPLPQATLHGSAGIAVPTLVSTLAISCVFTSVVFLEGPAKYLFTPLGLAVVFAMLASYGLSRTLTPITIGLLLKGEGHGAEGGWFARFHNRLERGFDRQRDGYAELLATLLTRRIVVPVFATAILALGTVMYIYICRARLLSGHRRGADPASRPRSGRHADREDRADLRGRREQDPRHHPGERARADRRQHRPAFPAVQPGLRRRLDDWRQ